MVIRNYHWLNSGSRVLISTYSAPVVQTRQHKQFSLFDLDLRPGLYKPRTGHTGRTVQCKNHAPAIDCVSVSSPVHCTLS